MSMSGKTFDQRTQATRYLPPHRRDTLYPVVPPNSPAPSSILSNPPSPTVSSIAESDSITPLLHYDDDPEVRSLASRIGQTRLHSPSGEYSRSETSLPARPVYIPPHLRTPTPVIPTGPRALRSPSSVASRNAINRVPNPRPSRGRLPLPRAMRQGLGEYIEGCVLHEVELSPLSPMGITHVRVAGGYKWIQPISPQDGPTIVVPGIPDIWVGRDPTRQKVRKDNELEGNVEFADYNAASVPTGYDPLEPVFHSLTSPAELNGVQILTGRSNLKKLFSFCLAHSSSPGNSSHQHRACPIRIDASVLQDTNMVILHRWESPRHAEARTPTNWHLSFHEANTREVFDGADRTSGCHRIVKYKWGGMGMMVKSDVGAAWPWPGLEVMLDSYGDEAQTRRGNYEEDESDEDDKMSTDTSVASLAPFAPSVSGTEADMQTTKRLFVLSAKKTISNGLTIIPTIIPPPPQGHLISLKTRRVDTEVELATPLKLEEISHIADVFAGMYFAQIPSLHLSRQKHGVFAEDDQRFLLGRGALGRLGVKYEAVLRSVRAILGWMVDVTKRKGRCSFVAVDGEIRAYEWEEGPKRFSDEAWDVIRQVGIVM